MRDDDTHGNKSQEKRRTRLRRPGPAAAALASLALLAAACSSGSANPGAGAGSPGKTSALAYSQCMRAHGIKNFPDPSAGGGVNILREQGTGLDPASPQFQAADKACKSLMPALALSPAQQAKMKAGNLKYAQCMRAHGIADFPDPNSQGQIQIQAKPGSDLDPNNPRYQSATKACQRYQPGGKGGSLRTSGNGFGGGA